MILDNKREYVKCQKFLLLSKTNLARRRLNTDLIAAGISVVIIATVNAIGTTLNAKFQSVCDPAQVTHSMWLDRKEAAFTGGFVFTLLVVVAHDHFGTMSAYDPKQTFAHLAPDPFLTTCAG